MNIYEIPVTTIDGTATTLASYRGHPMLIVNVASKCGFTPQYRGLEALYRENKDRGLVVLGFPCDQFGHQEPGDEAEIKRFCTTRYEVTFPMFAKIKVNGPDTHPLYQLLKAERAGVLGTESIKWNFTKFLVGPDGAVLKRYPSKTTPNEIEVDLSSLL